MWFRNQIKTNSAKNATVAFAENSLELLIAHVWTFSVLIQAVIDDVAGVTLASASTLDKEVSKGTKTEQAVVVGKLVAERAVAKGISEVVFDRGGYLYHGRVKALADSARENGLKF